MMKTSRKGFTLAEVLTTLMVIGVVAAMTIPTLMNSTEDQQRKVALKKAVSVLGQAVQLNKAKEVECTIGSSAALAACVGQSLAGSPNGDIISTADGMSYKFYYYGSTTVYSLEEACGAVFGSSQNAWKGANACGVIVDINGASKGASFDDKTTDESGKEISSIPSFGAQGFSAEPTTKDMYTLVLTDAGVRPTLFSETSRGYGFMYGEPSDVKAIFSDSCECKDATTGKITYEMPVADADGKMSCPTGCTKKS